jgi:plasmid stabilization system protein ParE
MSASPIRILWSPDSIRQLENLHGFIQEQSEQNADHIIDELLETVGALTTLPFRYPSDEYDLSGNPNIRCMVLHGIRVSYEVTQNSIHILRIRHSRQEPQSY